MVPDSKDSFNNKEYIEAKSLKSLLVRPIVAHERNEWDSLMARHHYLGLRSIVGEAMRYVAILDGRWVAIIGWGAAAFKSRHRDAWIGWKPQLQWQRLKFISNNVRFLILPDVHIPNLASKILSLNLKRLSRDWKEVYGHPIVLAETFVDTTRFTGTCYKASGWIPLGQPRGFRRGIRHRKISILAVSICAILSGAKSFAAIGEWAGRCTQNMLKRLWCRRDTETKLYAPPSEPTVRRLLQQIDAQAVDEAINKCLFTQSLPASGILCFRSGRL